jgi:hypothetical protein
MGASGDLIATAKVGEDAAGLKSNVFPGQAISRQTRRLHRSQTWVPSNQRLLLLVLDL